MDELDFHPGDCGLFALFLDLVDLIYSFFPSQFGLWFGPVNEQ